MKRRRPNRKPNQNRDRSTRLPRNAPPVELSITHVGARGDGVGRAEYTHHHRTDEHAVFVPAALPGERVLAQPVSLSGQGMKTHLSEILTASPQRREPDIQRVRSIGWAPKVELRDGLERTIAWFRDRVGTEAAR